MSGKAIVRRPGRSLLFVVTDSRVLAVVVVGLTLPLAVSVASEPPRLFDSVVRALSGSPDDAPPPAIDVADGPRVARPGETVTGRFASGDPMRLQGVSRRGRFMHVWTLDGRAGHTATINMSSSSVDPYLLVTGPGLSSALTDDDGGNGRSARLTIEFPGTGAYRVIASTYAWGETGEYTLSVSGTAAPRETSTTAVVEAPPPPPASPAASTPVASATRGGIAPGASVSGSLASGDPSRLSGVSRTGPYMHAWTIQGVAGQSVTFDMRSTTLDSYLMVTGPGLTSPLSDDDGGSGRDARLTVRFPRTGEYQPR